jgi:mannose-6-phosphate isomerase-like protein (cupin superfamily)
MWIANNPEYCGKVLEIDKGKRCSLHFHKLKLESFYLRRGKLKVRVKESPDASTIEESELSAGECIDVPRGLVHQRRQSRTVSSTRFRPSILTATHIV